MQKLVKNRVRPYYLYMADPLPKELVLASLM